MVVPCLRKMALSQSPFEKCKWILKCCLKIENVLEVQKHWKNELGTPPLTWITVTMLCGIFEI